jgi:Mg-chelatase subunit ChlD
MSAEAERLRRWRLVLGGGQADGIGCTLGGDDVAMDEVLSQLYDRSELSGLGLQGQGRRGGSEASQPGASRWLGDIRTYFPTSVVHVMQQDALERIGYHKLLAEPEILEMFTPDVHLVATLLTLKKVIPEKTRSTARLVVQPVVDDLLRRLHNPLRQAVSGALNRSTRNRRPRYREIDWQRTIRANLRHYQPDYRTIIPETLIGYGRRRSSLNDVILCIDQSGSMATSVVYAGIFGAVLASLPAVSTRLVLFDTSVVDMTAQLDDPVELLFGAQLGGGTDIAQALGYCQGLVRRPQQTVMVLITDLYEGGNVEQMFARAAALMQSGVQLITLLALHDEGAPSFDREHAARLAALGSPAFACTPDQFPDLMAAALTGTVAEWRAKNLSGR